MKASLKRVVVGCVIVGCVIVGCDFDVGCFVVVVVGCGVVVQNRNSDFQSCKKVTKHS